MTAVSLVTNLLSRTTGGICLEKLSYRSSLELTVQGKKPSIYGQPNYWRIPFPNDGLIVTRSVILSFPKR